jgi:hypothetical protein
MGYHTIKLKKWSDVQEEIIASAAITPGMLLERDSDNKVKPHSAAGQNAVRMFAVEDALQGKGINDAYASADPVQVWFPGRGDEVYAILVDGENVDEGDYVESNGDGKLKKHVSDVESFESAEAGSITVYPEQIVGQAVEAIDISDSSGAESSGDLGYDKRIRVKIV